MIFCSFDDDYITNLYFYFHFRQNDIKFNYYDNRTEKYGAGLFLCNEEYLKNKRVFYYAVFRHFFKKEIRVPYKLIDKDVPLELLRVR